MKINLINILINLKNILLILLLLFYISCENSSKKIINAKRGLLDLSSINFNEIESVNLDGEWEFFPNKFIEPNSNNSELFIQVPSPWNSQPTGLLNHNNFGYGSYRLNVKLNNTIQFPTIKFQYISSAYRIYCNGKEYQNSGNPGIDLNSTYPNITNDESTIFLDGNNNLEIILHVSNFHLSNGGILRSIYLGTNSSITNLHTREDAKHWLITGMIFIMGFYHLGNFFLRKKDFSPLYFGFYCLLSATREFFILERGINRIFPDITFIYWAKLDLFFLFFSITFFAYFMKTLFPLDTNRIIIRIAAWFHLLLGLVLLILPLKFIYIIENISSITILLLSIYYFFVLVMVLIHKRDSSVLFLFGFSIVYFCIINDLLISMNIYSFQRLLPYGITFLIVVQSYILSHRFNKALSDAETLSIQLNKMSNVKDEFMSNLSHEIRTPLSLIYAYSELIKDYSGPGEESIKPYGVDIFREANVLSENINDLMLVTDLETKFKIREDFIKIDHLVGEAIKYLEPFISEKSIIININQIDNLSIYCDKSLLIKVFIIIIKNSVVYNFFKGKIEIYQIQSNDSIILNIKDSGPGISQDDLPRIFDKFYRVDSSITYKVSGVGVGLFIAKRIMELHHFKISASSVLGKGTIIHLEFPKPKSE